MLKSWTLGMKKVQKRCNQFYSLFICTQEEYEISQVAAACLGMQEAEVGGLGQSSLFSK